MYNFYPSASLSTSPNRANSTHNQKNNNNRRRSESNSNIVGPSNYFSTTSCAEQAISNAKFTTSNVANYQNDNENSPANRYQKIMLNFGLPNNTNSSHKNNNNNINDKNQPSRKNKNSSPSSGKKKSRHQQQAENHEINSTHFREDDNDDDENENDDDGTNLPFDHHYKQHQKINNDIIDAAAAAAASSRIESRHLALPRPLDDACVVTLLPKIQLQFPFIHEALVRSDDIIGHAEQMLFAKQEEVDKCVVVSNQLVQELQELTRQHRDLTIRCEAIALDLRNANEQNENNCRELALMNRDDESNKRRKKYHNHHKSRKNDDKKNKSSSNNRKRNKKHFANSSSSSSSTSTSNSSDSDDENANDDGNIRNENLPKSSRATLKRKSDQLDQLQEAVADLLRTMDRFHSNPHIFTDFHNTLVMNQNNNNNNHQNSGGDRSNSSTNNNNNNGTVQMNPSSEKIFRTMWNSASASLRDHLVSIDPRWRHHILLGSSSPLLKSTDPQRINTNLRNSTNNTNREQLAPHVLALIQRLQRGQGYLDQQQQQMMNQLQQQQQQQNNINNNAASNALHQFLSSRQNNHQTTQSILMNVGQNNNNNNNNRSHSGSVSPVSNYQFNNSNNNSNNNSPNSANNNKDALLRAAMFELEESDKIVSQLVFRCNVLEEEKISVIQDAETLRDTNRRLVSEHTASTSADSKKITALEAMNLSLQKRLDSVESDRSRLLSQISLHNNNLIAARQRSVSSVSSSQSHQQNVVPSKNNNNNNNVVMTNQNNLQQYTSTNVVTAIATSSPNRFSQQQQQQNQNRYSNSNPPLPISSNRNDLNTTARPTTTGRFG